MLRESPIVSRLDISKAEYRPEDSRLMTAALRFLRAAIGVPDWVLGVHSLVVEFESLVDVDHYLAATLHYRRG